MTVQNGNDGFLEWLKQLESFGQVTGLEDGRRSPMCIVGHFHTKQYNDERRGYPRSFTIRYFCESPVPSDTNLFYIAMSYVKEIVKIEEIN